MPTSIILIGIGTPAAAGTFFYIPGAQGCSFTITFSANATNNSIAQYTLNGTPNSCTTPIISGHYLLGNALDSTCSVTIKATVITPGTYTIASNTANGIIFIGSGTFINTGQQSIILKASGRPNEVGDFIFTPGTNGCKFSINCTVN